MKQKKISYWLKGMTIVLGIMGLLGFAGLTWYAFSLKSATEGDPLWQFIFFSWYTAVLCYMILYQFWQVCTQIGRENSFSIENVRAFHRMGLCGAAEIAGLAARLIWRGVIHELDAVNILVLIVKVIFVMMFILLCEALSRLVQYAYDVKQENDLTI